MGIGIAQVAAAAGHTVYLFDARADSAKGVRAALNNQLAKLVEKGRMPSDEMNAILDRLVPVTTLDELTPAKLVIEAILEDVVVKREVFARLESILGTDAILATNTSSLSITAISNGLARPENVCGMHFFNPAAVMPLVEIVSGLATEPAVADRLAATAERWGKTAVRVRSTPGFIVNRIARPFYGEGLRLLQERAGDPATLDAVVRDCGSFKMGPFEVMDLVGHDVNFAVTSSIHAALFGDARFTPSVIQRELVDAGRLGRKSGQGFYDYRGKAAQQPKAMSPMPAPQAIQAIGDLGPAAALLGLATSKGIRISPAAGFPGDGRFVVDGVHVALTDGRSATIRASDENCRNLVTFDLARDFMTCPRIAIAAALQAESHALNTAAGFFQTLGKIVTQLNDVPGMIVARTMAMLINGAADVVQAGIATPRDIDLGMVKGTGYPVGPLQWSDETGAAFFLGVLNRLQDSYGEDRYRPSHYLRQLAAADMRFHSPARPETHNSLESNSAIS
jgi:3-hydroxybutyryl-CoA dehydrogenase